MNGIPGHLSSQIEELENKGFFVSEVNEGNDVIHLILRVTATANKNGTEIFCTSIDNNIVPSTTAIFLVIYGILS